MSNTRTASAPAVVRADVEIAAPPDRVFDALTDPRELAAWWGGDDDYRTTDWTLEPTPGREWSARTIDRHGREGHVGGEILVADAPHRLEYTWRTSWDDGESVVRYDLTPARVDGVPGTRVTVTHTAVHASTSDDASLGWRGVSVCLAREVGARRYMPRSMAAVRQRRASICL